MQIKINTDDATGTATLKVGSQTHTVAPLEENPGFFIATTDAAVAVCDNFAQAVGLCVQLLVQPPEQPVPDPQPDPNAPSGDDT